MKPSARKSYGEFKPLIIYNDGRTEICGQRGKLERIQHQTGFYSGPSEVWHAKRGVVFKSRDDAINYAKKVIEANISARRKNLVKMEEYLTAARSEKDRNRYQSAVDFERTAIAAMISGSGLK